MQVIALIIRSDILHKRAIDSGNVLDWNEYRRIRNDVVSRQKIECKNGQRKKLLECGQNTANIWKTVNNILNWSSEVSPNKLFFEGNMLTRSEDIASALNKFFLDKVRKIKENLPLPTVDPLEKLKNLMVKRTSSFELQAVHPDLVGKVIDGLKNSSSFGLDYIDTKIIKLVKPAILPALTHVINYSLPTNLEKSKNNTSV